MKFKQFEFRLFPRIKPKKKKKSVKTCNFDIPRNIGLDQISDYSNSCYYDGVVCETNYVGVSTHDICHRNGNYANSCHNTPVTDCSYLPYSAEAGDCFNSLYEDSNCMSASCNSEYFGQLLEIETPAGISNTLPRTRSRIKTNPWLHSSRDPPTTPHSSRNTPTTPHSPWDISAAPRDTPTTPHSSLDPPTTHHSLRNTHTTPHLPRDTSVVPDLSRDTPTTLHSPRDTFAAIYSLCKTPTTPNISRETRSPLHSTDIPIKQSVHTSKKTTTASNSALNRLLTGELTCVQDHQVNTVAHRDICTDEPIKLGNCPPILFRHSSKRDQEFAENTADVIDSSSESELGTASPDGLSYRRRHRCGCLYEKSVDSLLESDVIQNECIPESANKTNKTNSWNVTDSTPEFVRCGIFNDANANYTGSYINTRIHSEHLFSNKKLRYENKSRSVEGNFTQVYDDLPVLCSDEVTLSTSSLYYIDRNYEVSRSGNMQDSIDTGYASGSREIDLDSLSSEDILENTNDHASDQELEWDNEPSTELLTLMNQSKSFCSEESERTRAHENSDWMSMSLCTEHVSSPPEQVRPSYDPDLHQKYKGLSSKSYKRRSRSLADIEISLEDKVTMLREEKTYVQRKIQESIYEEKVRKQQDKALKGLSQPEKKEILLKTLNDLKTRLEDQSARLQSSYSTILTLRKRFSQRHKTRIPLETEL